MPQRAGNAPQPRVPLSASSCDAERSRIAANQVFVRARKVLEETWGQWLSSPILLWACLWMPMITSTLTAQAQITTLEEGGRTVYVNDVEPSVQAESRRTAAVPASRLVY